MHPTYSSIIWSSVAKRCGDFACRPKTRLFNALASGSQALISPSEAWKTNRVSSPSPRQRGIGLSSPDVAACRWAQKSLSVEWLNRS